MDGCALTDVPTSEAKINLVRLFDIWLLGFARLDSFKLLL